MDTAKQMQMAFMMEEGGLTDDGTTMDPVSGNEVPPGSMAEEVRDDIPAQLSEGEYVVPADVVRFYGVKFFEDLRSEAKRGLMDMEANGRIGGEPVAQTIDNQTGGELTPEELAALEQIQGMAVGGMVQPTQSTNPYLQQQQLYQNPAPVAMGNVGYAQGGQVLYAQGGVDVSTTAASEDANIDPYQPQFGTQQASMFSPGYLIDQTLGTAPSPVRTVIMYGPNGEVETLTLPAQQTRYEELLELGYSETQTQTTTETSVGRDDEGEPVKAPPQSTEALDVDSLKSEDLAKTAKGLSTMANIATALASTASLPVAAFINTSVIAQYNDIVNRMDEEGINTEGLKTRGSIFGGESGIYENLQDLDDSGGASFGDTWLGDLLGFDGEAGIAEGNPGLRASFAGARRTGGDDDDTPAVTPEPSVEPENEPDVNAVANEAAAQAEQEQQTAGNVESFEQTIERGGGFNKGGMIKRRTKKKKNK